MSVAIHQKANVYVVCVRIKPDQQLTTISKESSCSISINTRLKYGIEQKKSKQQINNHKNNKNMSVIHLL